MKKLAVSKDDWKFAELVRISSSKWKAKHSISSKVKFSCETVSEWAWDSFDKVIFFFMFSTWKHKIFSWGRRYPRKKKMMKFCLTLCWNLWERETMERGNKSCDQNVLNFVFSRTFLREKLFVFYREYSTQITKRFPL